MTKKLPWTVTSTGTSERKTPVTPPMRKLNSIPRQNSIGASKRIFAFQSVPSVTRNKKPVGMEISSVVNMKRGRMSGLMPLWKRWCCHTKKDSNATPIIPAAATRRRRGACG